MKKNYEKPLFEFLAFNFDGEMYTDDVIKLSVLTDTENGNPTYDNAMGWDEW